MATDIAAEWALVCENRSVMAEPRFDDLDLRIIDALAEDGRRPYTSVADELGVAEATIRSRVARLQRIEAIRFVTDVKPHELGLLFAYLGVRIGGRDVRRSIDAICRIPEAVYVIECTGQYDVLVEIVAQDGDDLLRVMQERDPQGARRDGGGLVRRPADRQGNVPLHRPRPSRRTEDSAMS